MMVRGWFKCIILKFLFGHRYAVPNQDGLVVCNED